MRVFIEVYGLLELEQAGKWEEAKDILYDLWRNDKYNIDKLCRLISECWYVLSLWEIVTKKDESSFHSFKLPLLEATRFGLVHFNSHPQFLWMVGYMISLFPYLFYEEDQDSLYEDWERTGKKMLRYSTQIMPEDSIAKVLYLGTERESAQYISEKNKLFPQLNDFFPGYTAIEEYFKDVLSL